VELSGETVPAGVVGGDYFDFLAPADGLLLAVVADVMGKGLEAALLMLGLRSTLRSVARLRRDHRAILEHLDAVAGEDLRRNRSFATLCLATIFPRERRAVFTNAGHCPPLLLRDGRGSFLPGRGVALGLPAVCPRPAAVRLRLAPGDVLLLYTDGLLEARDAAGQRFGRERFAAVSEGLARLPAPAIKERILERVEAFAAGGKQRDDITLAVIKLGEAGEAPWKS
jgi:sigma-B regulation protein RsbU (phosphoserine phosphatase)